MGKGGSHVPCDQGRAHGGLGLVEKSAGLPAGQATSEPGSALLEGALSQQNHFWAATHNPRPSTGNGPSAFRRF